MSLIEINRLFGFDDLVTKYGGPRSLWEKLRPRLPVFCTQDSVPVYLESEVDDFLKAVRDGIQLNSPRLAVPEFGLPVEQSDGKPEFVTVAQAQRRYLAGMRSRRWWYRMVETGKIAHHRVGDSIMFRTQDIEEFIAKSRKEQPEQGSIDPAPLPPLPIPIPTPVQSRPRNKPEDDPSRFRFFPRR